MHSSIIPCPSNNQTHYRKYNYQDRNLKSQSPIRIPQSAITQAPQYLLLTPPLRPIPRLRSFLEFLIQLFNIGIKHVDMSSEDVKPVLIIFFLPLPFASFLLMRTPDKVHFSQVLFDANNFDLRAAINAASPAKTDPGCILSPQMTGRCIQAGQVL